MRVRAHDVSMPRVSFGLSPTTCSRGLVVLPPDQFRPQMCTKGWGGAQRKPLYPSSHGRAGGFLSMA